MIVCNVQSGTAWEQPIFLITTHVATLQDEQWDDEQQVARVLQRSDVPVDAVATGAHGPGDEGSGHTRPERNWLERVTFCESLHAKLFQTVRQWHGGERTAVHESSRPNAGKGVGECEGGDRCAAHESVMPNCGKGVGECEGGDATAAPERTIPNGGNGAGQC